MHVSSIEEIENYKASKSLREIEKEARTQQQRSKGQRESKKMRISNKQKIDSEACCVSVRDDGSCWLLLGFI
jgi:hypothetical protein